MSITRIPSQYEIMSLVISSVNELLSRKDVSLAGPLGESTYLIGSESVIDSLGLVTLVVDLEQKLEEEYGIKLVLSNEEEMTRQNSPFQTVKSLTDYICSLVQEK